MYYCYLIYSTSSMKTYIGITNNLDKRLKQHNKLLKGGAKCTKQCDDWNYKIIVEGFKDRATVSSFEWYWKHQQTIQNKWTHTRPGIDNKINRLHNLLSEERWKHLTICYEYKEMDNTNEIVDEKKKVETPII